MAEKGDDVETTSSAEIGLTDNGSSGGSCCGLEYPNDSPHPVYTRFQDRRCTNILCTICFAVALLGWMICLILATISGKPQILFYSIDSFGNTCGFSESNKVTVLSSDGSTTIERTNTFEDGTAPSNLKAAKVGVYPRIVDDVAAQVTAYASDGKADIKFTTYCVDSCPSAGDIVCSYTFLNRYNGSSVSGITNPINPVTADSVFRMKRVTAEYSRTVVLATGTLDGLCSSVTAQEKEFCKDTFVHCDYVPSESTKLLGRCLPYIYNAPENKTERCVQPLTANQCDPATYVGQFGSTSEFNTRCIQGRDGNYYLAQYYPTSRIIDSGAEKWLLNSADESRCVRLETSTASVSQSIPQASYLSSLSFASQLISQYMGDVFTTWYVVLLSGLVLPLLLSFVWTAVMRFCAAPMVWMSIVLFILMCLALGIYALVKGGVIEVDSSLSFLSLSSGSGTEYSSLSTSTDYTVYYQILGWCLLIFAVVAVCMVLFARKAIQSAIHIIQTSAHAITALWRIVFFPVITFLGIGVTAVVFISTGILLLTCGDLQEASVDLNLTATPSAAAVSPSTVDSFEELKASFSPDTIVSKMSLRYAMLYNLFMFLWTTEFIQAIGIMTIGGAVSHWYFAVPPSNSTKAVENMDKSKYKTSICCSWWMSVRFHTGTAAFGAFIIAVVQMVRLVFEYIQHKMNSASEELKNKCWYKFITCCISCCLHCLERCMKFVSKQAYIHTAIAGDAFCHAAYSSFKLIFNNLLRFGATNSLTAILMILGKIFVMCASALFGYAWVSNASQFTERSSESYVTSKLFIAVVILMTSYLVAEAFFNVFHVAIDSVLLSYCIDIEKGSSCRHGLIAENVKGLGMHDETPPERLEDDDDDNRGGFFARCC